MQSSGARNQRIRCLFAIALRESRIRDHAFGCDRIDRLRTVGPRAASRAPQARGSGRERNAAPCPGDHGTERHARRCAAPLAPYGDAERPCLSKVGKRRRLGSNTGHSVTLWALPSSSRRALCCSANPRATRLGAHLGFESSNFKASSPASKSRRDYPESDNQYGVSTP